ncbi:MAG: C39 family peptidase [Clostridia bacterium]|nr:C39 family peptidase [Clostridia bacterium]
MKKYLSCIILIIACVVCAMIFYVNAKAPSDDPASEQQSESSSSQASTESESVESLKKISLNENGTILSEYFCSSRLRIEWSTLKYEGEDKLYINAELYLDSPNGISRECGGSFIINGQEEVFVAQPSKEKSTLLQALSIEIADFQDGSIIRASGSINLEFVGEGGVSLSALSIEGKIYQSEQNKRADSYLLPLEHISQYPSLPSGDEITSLAMVLRFLKYNVNECDLCDLYLDKGPVGFTDFYKANAGNPRDTYNSYGCLAPVIVSSATKFISANGGSHTAYDYTGYNTDELYRQVSLGNPVIVWLCDDFGNTPSISRIWVVDGKTLYLKSNMACMVLTGYDYTKGTVTLANPAGNTFSLEMNTFEKSFADMGSYAVIVK